MNLAGFCRNCLSKWYLAAAEEKGLDLDYAAARELVYGMPYEEWKAKHQSEATPEQKAAFAESHKHGCGRALLAFGCGLSPLFSPFPPVAAPLQPCQAAANSDERRVGNRWVRKLT